MVGSLAIIAGGSLALFAFWQANVQDPEFAAIQRKAVASFSRFRHPDFPPPSSVSREGQVFARITLPRLGNDFTRLIGEGTRWEPTLNRIGIGHYRNTAMPGESGNFALAGHRGGFGGVFRNIDEFRAGDEITVETDNYRYTYRYLQTKIVAPSDIDVIAAVPKELRGAHPGGAYLTLTSCEPIYVNTQRIAVWFELAHANPLDAG